MEFDWADLAFGSKKPINSLGAVFIAAPRELSIERFTQLVKQYLPMGNIVLGVAKDECVVGFEGQPQFRMLRVAAVQKIINKVNASASPNKIYTLTYSQREQKFLLEKLKFRRVICVNGSWQYSFHMTETYYTLMRAGMPYECVSPFADEIEARQMAELTEKTWPVVAVGSRKTEGEMLQLAADVATRSFDHTYQTGVALTKRQASGKYTLLASSYNRVVPYQTYAWHHGPLREVHFSPANDLNYYDTVHAEMELLVTAARERINLKGTTLFINLLPCPGCARTLSETDIEEFVYQVDHSDGYAIKMLESAGKTVRRVV